ncbi:hypothetical protein PIB30_041248 [Stylosanthes scabra]|uniref:Uncharacterized protein n=1 Tax=Stylosanthes scabra TaxID=79078 RepID=A0ABU6UDI0_9FABA|nr:hypothetical protein [Stylosanthes scabra]
MEEIQDRSHEDLQQEEGQTAVKTDRDKKETNRKDLPREDRSKREQRSGKSYYNPLNASLTIFLHEYHKQNGHDTEDCRDLLEFVEKGLKKGKFREYTGRSIDQRDDRRTRQIVDSPEKSTEGRDEPKDGVTRREIKIISGGLPDEGSPPSRKAAKRSKHSYLATEVMPRTLHDKPPPEITFSSEKIGRTTDTLNPPLVISMDVIDATIRRVFIDQESSADILFQRCFDALGLTDKDLESHSDCCVERPPSLARRFSFRLRLDSEVYFSTDGANIKHKNVCENLPP